MTQIRIVNVSKSYGPGSPAVDDVSLTVEAGEFFFLLGPSGCGKTTLLRIVAGLLDATSGRVWFGQRDVTDLPPEHRRAAMVFQNYALWPHMTVGQNVEFAPKMEGKPANARRETVAANLARVQMEEYTARKPAQLSGGQQQRVALARALAAEGDILLLDEPLSNLDARLRAHMRTELRELVKSSGRTALYVTHDQAEALSMADRIAVLNAGKIAQVGTPTELYEEPASTFVADFLGEANFFRGTIATEAGDIVTIHTNAGEIVSTSHRLAASRRRARPVDCQRGEIICCVRPENIILQPATSDAPPGATVLPATIVSRTYLGQSRQYVCQLPGGTNWKATQLGAPEQEFQPKQTVQLVIAPSKVILLTV